MILQSSIIYAIALLATPFASALPKRIVQYLADNSDYFRNKCRTVASTNIKFVDARILGISAPELTVITNKSSTNEEVLWSFPEVLQGRGHIVEFTITNTRAREIIVRRLYFDIQSSQIEQPMDPHREADLIHNLFGKVILDRERGRCEIKTDPTVTVQIKSGESQTYMILVQSEKMRSYVASLHIEYLIGGRERTLKIQNRVGFVFTLPNRTFKELSEDQRIFLQS